MPALPSGSDTIWVRTISEGYSMIEQENRRRYWQERLAVVLFCHSGGNRSGHEENVRTIAFSPAGKTLASASFDETVKLWDVSNGKEKATFKGHEREVCSVAFSPDGKTLAAASQDMT